MAADLPPELLRKIFSRLAVQSLLRFRTISKSLKSLMDSHKFINLHLKNSLNFNLILQSNTKLYELNFPSLTKFIIELNHPFNSNNDSFTRNSTMALIGSCNGLVAISNGKTAFKHPDDANEITIWNPNTGKHRIIPSLPLPIPNILESDNIDRVALCTVCVHGFGFDPLSGDYKLLRISLLSDIHYSFESHVRLFSLKTNSWKIIPSMPLYNIYYAHAMGIFVENSLHWIMTPKIGGSDPCLIVAFNLTLEIFNVVPLPEEVNRESFEINVAVLEGCLCMILNYRNTEFDVWVMKEYGSRDSWCKLFTLMEPCFLVDLEILRPLCYSSDGSKVLLEGIHVSSEGTNRNLIWYDLKSEQVSFVKGIPNFNGIIVCVGSLVPPSFPVDNSRKKENHTSKSKKRYFY